MYLNPGLTINFNGNKLFSDNGLKDLLEDRTNVLDLVYPIIHLKGNDIEIAISHSKTQYNEEYHSFVNGQNTTQGGTHQAAFREAIVKTIRDYFGKNYGSYLLTEAIKISFKNGAQRVWVHTCSLDHKNALKNYISRGMKIFKSEKVIIN